MDYYKKKAMAFQDIDNMLREDKTIDEIELKISTKYGFGRKLIEERMELIKNVFRENNPSKD